MNKATPEQYVKALIEVSPTCCPIPGSEPQCGYCPNYKIIINQIRRSLMTQHLNGYGLPNPSWEFYSIWQNIISLSDLVDEVGFFVCQQEKLDDNSVEIVTKYLSSILTKTSEAYTVVESVKREKSFG